MHIFPFILVIAAMIPVVLAPEKVNGFLLSRVPLESRKPAKRLVPVALIAIFAFTFLAFYFHRPVPPWQENRVGMSDPAQTLLMLVGGVVFLVYGLFACLRPIRFVSVFSPQLRHHEEGLSERSLTRIEVVSRLFGILLVVVSAFLFAKLRR
jgi:hypothetical protein